MEIREGHKVTANGKEYEVLKPVDPVWQKLYDEARKVQRARSLSPYIDAGQVAAALLTKSGNIYVGVCIDTACTLGMCAERNAIANMITNGENQIDKIVAVMGDGKVGPPCGACREFMMQLDRDSGDIEILLDLETGRTVTLKRASPGLVGEKGNTGRYRMRKYKGGRVQ